MAQLLQQTFMPSTVAQASRPCHLSDWDRMVIDLRYLWIAQQALLKGGERGEETGKRKERDWWRFVSYRSRSGDCSQDSAWWGCGTGSFWLREGCLLPLPLWSIQCILVLKWPLIPSRSSAFMISNPHHFPICQAGISTLHYHGNYTFLYQLLLIKCSYYQRVLNFVKWVFSFFYWDNYGAFVSYSAVTVYYINWLSIR